MIPRDSANQMVSLYSEQTYSVWGASTQGELLALEFNGRESALTTTVTLQNVGGSVVYATFSSACSLADSHIYRFDLGGVSVTGLEVVVAGAVCPATLFLRRNA